MREVVVSGYFDPLHIGHIQLFKEAHKLGMLTVIVNNDKQTLAKKGYVFMPAEERKEIILELRDVWDVVLSVDTDSTVCETLKELQPQVFANGGDRFEDNIPEKILCDELGIKMVFNLGEKIQSSSELVRRANAKK